MTFGSIVLLGVGLALDATAAAGVKGLAAPRIRRRDAVLVAAYFGGFQAMMPVLGWLLGTRIGPAIGAWDHWIAFALLVAIGGKMLRESTHSGVKEAAPTERQLWGVRTMTTLAVATSIDAFAVGITLPILGAPLFLSVATIGITTAALSAGGLYAGRRFGALLGKRLDALGGIILIGLGTKLLIEHLSGN
jgi:putative Mn2+ efflux pump MntP